MSHDAHAATVTALAAALWANYNYHTTFAPWDHMVRLLGVDPDSLPEGDRRAAVAANRCLAAARAAFEALRHLPIALLQESLLVSAPKLSEGLDIFSPIHAWTDGSGTVAEKPAGAGVVIRYHGPGGRMIGWGHPLGLGTNNHAELWGIRLALEGITGPDRVRPVVVHSDSMYAIGAASGKNKVNANPDLVHAIRKLTAQFRALTFQHVHGHTGVRENEWADKLAGRAREGQRRVELAEITG